MDSQYPTSDRRSGPTRRTVLAGTALTAIGALAGCIGDEDEVHDPITIQTGQICDNCTMDIVEYPGPVGQSFYETPEDVLPDEEDRPAQFCSSLCTYTFTFEHEDEAEPEVTYLTDYSIVDYEIDESGEDPEISSHVEAEAFARADELTLVADSEVQGAMGTSMIGFSDADEAAEFQDEHGGDRYEHDEVDQQLIMSLM